MDVVDVVVIAFVTLDVLMKLKDWVSNILMQRRRDDDRPGEWTRGEINDLLHIVRELEASQTSGRGAIVSMVARASYQIRLLLQKVDPGALLNYDSEMAAPGPRARAHSSPPGSR